MAVIEMLSELPDYEPDLVIGALLARVTAALDHVQPDVVIAMSDQLAAGALYALGPSAGVVRPRGSCRPGGAGRSLAA